MRSHTQHIQTQGFTLVELLIGMLLIGILLGVIFTLFQATVRDTSNVVSRADLIKEAQIAQQLISGRITDSIFIWSPAMTDESLKKFNLGTNVSVAPLDSEPWQVVQSTDTVKNTFLAMILPPRIRYDAGICNNTASTRKLKEDHCYRFFAYFPQSLKSLQSLPADTRPPADSANPEAWVLMEYRLPLANWNSPTGTGGTLATAAELPRDFLPTDMTASVLVNYIEPQSVDFDITVPTNRTAGALWHVPDSKVRVAFTVKRIVESGGGRRTWREAVNFSATARNWICKGADSEICGPIVP